MDEASYHLLPEGIPATDYVDDLEFTEVTRNGEVYTLFRIVRITDEISNHADEWTHRANVVRVRTPAIGVALLRVVDRVIEDAKVTLSDTQE